MLRLWGIPSVLRYPLLLAVRRRAGIDLLGVRPIEAVSQVRAPVLFVHGAADEQVPPYHSELMAEVRRREGLPTERWILPGGEHGFDGYPPPGIFWNRVLDFFDRALGGPPPDLAL
jgi:dipeptidyl aminopeptidase/acylaminoacyl peptidase